MGKVLIYRLVFALLIIASVVVFVPFIIEAKMNKKIDTTSMIPESPSISLLITKPVRPKKITEEKIEEPFQLKGVPSDLRDEVNLVSPSLSSNGLPIGWVLKVKSFKDKKSAVDLSKKLLSDGYRAFVRSLVDDGRQISTVFIGPKIIKEKLLHDKEALNKKYGFDANIIRFGP